jgi:DNA-binding CsgD family transcriptional regulator
MRGGRRLPETLMPHTVLSRSDLASALDFVREGATAADPPAFRRHVLEGLPRLVPSAMTSYNDLSADGAPLLAIDPPDAWTADRERDFLRLAAQNPLIAHYVRTGETRPMKISDLMSRRAFRATELYRVVYGPMGVEYQMAVTLPAEPGAVLGIALNRDRRDFSERDRQMLALLRPHLAQLRHDAVERDAGRTFAHILERILDDRGQAALALGRRDAVAAVSPHAPALLGAYLAPAASPRRLPEALGRWLAQERARGLAPPRPFVVDGSAGTLVARLLPAAEPGGQDVILLEERRAGDAGAALAALGLSERQAEILSLVAGGRTNADVAALLHISPRTVQKHLEHIYDRLGVRSRSAAAARAVAAIGHAPC